MQLDNYIQANDEIRVVYRSQTVDSFTGITLLQTAPADDCYVLRPGAE
jgi:hypothetical protein